MADPEGDAVPIPERKFRAEVVKRWEKMQAWMAKKDAEDKPLFAMIKRFHPEMGGVESAPGSSPCQRTVTPPPAPGKDGLQYEQSTDLSITPPKIKFSSKKKLAIGGAGVGGVGLIVLVVLMYMGMIPTANTAPNTVTQYITAPGTAEAGAFVRAVRADEDSWWNLTDSQRDLGEDAITALGGE